jgi:hypothetical protein
MNCRFAWVAICWPPIVECASSENVVIEKTQMNQKLTSCSTLARRHQTRNR